MSALTFALRYADLGFPVIPLHSPNGTACDCHRADCSSPAKHPRTKNGLKDASTDRATIERWWKMWPAANVGLVVPPGYVVLDFDEDGPNAIVGDRPLPETAVAQTGRGWHFLYRTERDLRPAVGVLPHLDVRAPGSYVVVAPSRHVSGRTYTWITPPTAENIAAAPAWIGELVAGEPITVTGPAAPVPDAIPEGGRNAALTSLAGTMRRRGMTPEAIAAALLAENAARCRPPLPDADVRAIARSVGRYEPAGDAPASPAPDGTPATIGTRTAAELDHGPPPPQLADPFIAPRGVTILYGKGGTGKGVTAAHLAGRLVRSGHVVMILDYEGHPEEWGYRLRGLGLTAGELAQVHYREPYGLEWTAPKGPLRDVAHLVREDAARLGVTVVMIDSYTTATSTGDTMGGAAAAQEFFAGCAMVGLPTLVLAHVKGDAQKFPDRPFGSVYVHNLARETWAVEALEPADEDPDNPHAPELVRLEFRNMKRNRGGRRAPVFLTFAFHADGSIDAADETPGRRSLADLIDAVLDEPMTPEAIARAIAEDTDETPAAKVVRETMRRHPRRFAVDKSRRPHTWSRRP